MVQNRKFALWAFALDRQEQGGLADVGSPTMPHFRAMENGLGGKITADPPADFPPLSTPDVRARRRPYLHPRIPFPPP